MKKEEVQIKKLTEALAKSISKFILAEFARKPALRRMLPASELKKLKKAKKSTRKSVAHAEVGPPQD